MDVGKCFPDYTASLSGIASVMQSSILFYGHAEWRHVPWTRTVASHVELFHVRWSCKLASCSLYFNSDPQMQNTSVNYSTASYVTINSAHNTCSINLTSWLKTKKVRIAVTLWSFIRRICDYAKRYTNSDFPQFS
jgi:hypothetical protein